MSISVITPVAAYHLHLIDQVSKVVQSQTITCEHIVIVDHDKRGAGWARNEGLRQCTTDYVIFLDADDSIDPMFAEKCLSVIRPKHYVYTAWWVGDKGNMPLDPCKVWRNKDNHIITTLIATADARRVMFNEQYLGLEDVAFYLGLLASGVCGILFPEPLFNYGQGGKRSHSIHGTPYEANLLERLRYEYRGIAMACCNGSTPQAGTPIGVQMEGDVLATVLFGGNRLYIGRETRRNYGRIGLGKTVWMSPADTQADSASFAVQSVEDKKKVNLIDAGNLDGLGTLLWGVEALVYHEAKGINIPLGDIAELLA